jgi:NADH-quinone oxidoreductase subunit H
VSNNPYTLLGGSRAALAELGFEIPLALALFGPSLITGSLRISTVTGTILQKMISLEGVFYLIPWLVLFFVAVLSATAVIERVPFDPAHAETELTAGWLTELTGRQYAFAKLGALTIEFGLAGVIAGIFLGGPMTYLWSFLLTLFVSDATLLSYLYLPIVYGLGFVVFFIKTIFVVALITGMRTLHGRLRIDQMTSIFWTTLLPLALAGIVLLVILAIPAANYIRAFGF